MDADQKRRLHWLMYGLYYPAVLGTGVVVTLQNAAHSIHGLAIPGTVTAGAFFSLSFASAMGFEKEYGWPAFVLDTAEVIGMFACFFFLNLPDANAWAKPLVTVAYVVLIVVLVFQLLWRKAMELQIDAYLDLKLGLALLLLIGAVLGAVLPDDLAWAHWGITALFSVIAWLYVRNHPYQKDHKLPRWFLAGKPPQAKE